MASDHLRPVRETYNYPMEMMKPIVQEPLGTNGAADLSASERELLFETLPILLDIGEALMIAGADVRYVERKIDEMGYAYGASGMNSFVITASMLVTMTLPSGRGHTLSRRVETAPSTDYDKLHELWELCDDCCNHPLPTKTLRERFMAIQSHSIGPAELFVGGILAVAAFAVFFGGTMLDALVAAVVGAFVCCTLKSWRAYLPNTLIYNFCAALASGLLIYAVDALIPGLQPGTIIAGVIMILIPGIPMTNAIRDLIAGDTLTGIMRLVESLLWATSLALGFILAMAIMGWIL